MMRIVEVDWHCTDVGADNEDEMMARIPMVIVVESGLMIVVTIVVMWQCGVMVRNRLVRVCTF